MFKLTGKCKDDFVKYIGVSEHIEIYDNLGFDFKEEMINALIIDFFDSKEIFIHVKRNCTGIKFNHWYCIITDIKGVHLNNFLKDESKEDNRNLILNCAIAKANEIYNAKDENFDKPLKDVGL